MDTRQEVRRWVDEVAALCQPDRVEYCDGSDAERRRLTAVAVSEGTLVPLDETRMPGCTLHRSDPSDVARSEHLTFICSASRDDAGPTNNWMDPGEARQRLGALFAGSMRGRTLYVIPFLMGPPGSPFAKMGVQITDSVYVVLGMRIMTRMGTVAWEQASPDFVRCLHSLGDLSPERRFICHFPDDNAVWSIGSGYGGNALLGKKCFALRLASVMGRREGWLAEHMLILGIQNPEGQVHYVAGAFPSACGKTNLAMLVPPEALARRGWKVWTVGDDIAWLRPGKDGRLWAVNPEAGFFGVVPGTSSKTNPNAMATIAHDTIYTNVALRPDGTVWWEGHDDPPPARGMLDWQGRPWAPGGDKAAHPNSRFTAPASQCPSISPRWQDPHGVPISAILFGARRQRVVPLVYQARSWQHGVFLGATLASETTAAASGKVGVMRRDAMAMQPFCGYNMADYWGHWLDVGARLTRPPEIFRVNWFRTDGGGKFLWPGFGENLRVLQWVLARCAGGGDATDTAIGMVPGPEGIDRTGLDVSDQVMRQLLHVDRAEWIEAVHGQEEHFERFGDRVPPAILDEHRALARRVAGA